MFNWNFFGLVRAMLVSGKELAASSIGDFAFKLDIPLMNSFLDSCVLASSGTQVAMQTMIVIAELVLELC